MKVCVRFTRDVVSVEVSGCRRLRAIIPWFYRASLWTAVMFGSSKGHASSHCDLQTSYQRSSQCRPRSVSGSGQLGTIVCKAKNLKPFGQEKVIYGVDDIRCALSLEPQAISLTQPTVWGRFYTSSKFKTPVKHLLNSLLYRHSSY